MRIYANMSLHIAYADVITYANKVTYTDVAWREYDANITSDLVTALKNVDVTYTEDNRCDQLALLIGYKRRQV